MLARRASRAPTGPAPHSLLWGGWLLVTGITFSLGKGIIHPYYTVALAPAIGALVGIGVSTWWRRRSELLARVILGVCLAGTAVWAYTLLQRTPAWMSWLATTVAVIGITKDLRSEPVG